MLDNIGLDTVCKIATYWGEVLGDKSIAHSAEHLAERVASGKLGVKTNEGFYRYPNPSFQNEGFVVDSDRRSPQGPRHHQRFLLKLVEAAIHPHMRPKFAPTGAALIVGKCASSRELAERLAHQGLDVHRIVGDSVSNVAASFGELIEQGPVDHLFCFAQKLECLRDPRQFDEQIIGEFELVRNWYQHLVSLNRLDSATFTGITYLGGDFGVNGPPAQPLGGALVGLARALFVEGAASNSLGPRTKVVDLPANSTPSDDVAKILLETAISQASVVTGSRNELIDRLANTEVGYAEGRRQVIRLVADKVSFFSVPALKPGQWIFTGGARGITAEVARTMGRQCGVSLHLVGRSLLPETDYTQLSEEELDQLKRDVMTNAYREGRKPNADWDVIARGMECQRNIQRMRDDGIEVTYHSCDVCDRAAVEQLFAEVRKHGPVRGIVHGAGVEITCRIEKKEKAGIRATIGPKSLGTLALMEASYDDPLEFFAAFGSLAGRFGGSGRADNLLANELQAKLIGWYRGHRPECKSVLFHWPGWAEVGMSARPESRRGLLARDHNLLSTADGVRFFMHELAIGAPSSEVAIIDDGELPPAWRHKESTNA